MLGGGSDLGDRGRVILCRANEHVLILRASLCEIIHVCSCRRGLMACNNKLLLFIYRNLVNQIYTIRGSIVLFSDFEMYPE